MSFVRKFYIADTHWSHANIISFCDRPFRNVGGMDEQLIRRWNSVVGENDIVYHLGDFALGLQDVERVRWIFDRLKGRKHLVTGNHDLDRQGRLHPTLAGLSWAETPAAAMTVGDGGTTVYLHHYACRIWPGARSGGWHFFGHSHGRLSGYGRSRDVGADMPDVGFVPRTFDELTRNFSINPLQEET